MDITSIALEEFIADLHQEYKPKTVRRKLASLKAFFHYLEYREIIDRNPFSRIQIRFREPVILPKTIPLRTIETFLSVIYNQHRNAQTDYQKKKTLQDAAVIELLFATGMRISELCSLKMHDVNLDEKSVLIYGKGAKERKIQLGNNSVLCVLKKYKTAFLPQMQACNHFFVKQSGVALSDQSVRRMINKYTALASIEMHITPHMFRHTFATLQLAEGTDIYTVSKLLTHSNLATTQVYADVVDELKRDAAERISLKIPTKEESDQT